MLYVFRFTAHPNHDWVDFSGRMEGNALRKNRYYVSIHSGEISGEILQEKSGSPYEFEIEATDEEVRELQQLMGRHADEDTDTFWDAHIPFLNYNQRKENTETDDMLQEVYQKVYELGTPETRRQMEHLNLVE